MQVEESATPESILAIDPSELWGRHHHKSIKHVTITGFCPTTELMALTFHILENAVSLQSLTLDSRIRGFGKGLVARISQDSGTRDYKEWQSNFVGNEETLWLTRRSCPDWEAYLFQKCIISHIIERVPSSVELKILGTPPAEVMFFFSKMERHWGSAVCPRWENYISSLRNS